MCLNKQYNCDVLVAGAGIAGIRAAIAAAEAGRKVLLACAGEIFSGSSFYPGTWGLGLIGPENEADRADLADSICQVGCGMADPALVDSFVAGITPAIEEVKAMGVQLKQAADQGQKDFIPCFDRKHRAWNGILFDSARAVFAGKLAELGVELLPHCRLLELTRHAGRVDGAVMARAGELFWVCAGAVVLCTGGMGSLYRHRLTTNDVLSTGQALALDAGAKLTNLEFMQMMPGYVTPAPKTIFNEKTFRYVEMTGAEGENILPADTREALLEQRSTHGPFTSRLADRAVDLAILAHQGEDGVLTRYTPAIRENTPEFVLTYFDWLREKKGLTVDDPIRMAIFAHASNGGVVIDENGFTGVPGLYAAGEVTGGMHGADRIGGLSTANGLVFGARAGRAAAADVGESAREDVAFDAWTIPDAKQRRAQMQELMTAHALVSRNGHDLERTCRTVAGLLEHAQRVPGGTAEEVADSYALAGQLKLVRCVLSAQLLRTESRGSHYRSDYPEENPDLAKRIVIKMEGEIPATHFEA